MKKTTDSRVQTTNLGLAPLDKFQPKPTKRDILMATAKALHEEHVAEQAKNEEAIEAATANLKDAARRLLIKSPAVVRGMCCEIYGGDVQFTHCFKRSTPELKPLSDRLAELKAKRRGKKVEDFVKDLRDRTADNSDVVMALLADSNVKAALLQVGKAALNRVSTKDKAGALEA